MLNTEVLKKHSLIIALICNLIELSHLEMDSYSNPTGYANEPKLSALKIPCSGQEQEQLVNWLLHSCQNFVFIRYPC